jgi:hypothetical protein
MSDWFVYNNKVYNRSVYERFGIVKRDPKTYTYEYYVEARNKRKSSDIKFGFESYREARNFLIERIFPDCNITNLIKIKEK